MCYNFGMAGLSVPFPGRSVLSARYHRLPMLFLLVGPKGTGKSHVGRLLERTHGIRFFHVEPLWMQFNAACRDAGRSGSIAEGLLAVLPAVRDALAADPHVSVETTGASAEILEALLGLAGPAATFVIRVRAPLSTCLERIARRDPTHQIPMEEERIREVYRLGEECAIACDVELRNEALADAEILAAVRRSPRWPLP